MTLIDAATHRAWIASIGKRAGAERLPHLICEMSKRMEAVGLVEAHSFQFPVTQADLADALGFSSSTPTESSRSCVRAAW